MGNSMKKPVKWILLLVAGAVLLGSPQGSQAAPTDYISPDPDLGTFPFTALHTFSANDPWEAVNVEFWTLGDVNYRVAIYDTLDNGTLSGLLATSSGQHSNDAVAASASFNTTADFGLDFVDAGNFYAAVWTDNSTYGVNPGTWEVSFYN